METIQAIKPGPKPDKKDGTPDERRRVNPPLPRESLRVDVLHIHDFDYI